jgi:hypothetical protein
VEKKRIPIDTILSSRDPSLVSDGLLVNCYVETSPLGKTVVKRPGLAAYQQYPAGVGQGAFNFDASPLFIIGDVLQPVGKALSPTKAGQPFTFSVLQQQGTQVAKLFFKSTTDAYQWDGTTLTTITGNANYPALTVPGCVTLDTTTYVMTPGGQIYGSALNDPTTWTALNFIGADDAGDTPVMLARQLAYIVALRERSMQFFYDAGNAEPGSPLSDVPSASQNIGCASAQSVLSIDNNLFFAAKSNSYGHTIVMMNGFDTTKVSNVYIDRLLDADGLSDVNSFTFKVAGHSWYLLNLNTLNTAIAYDVVEQAWSVWTSAAGNHAYSTYDGVSDMFLHQTNGTVERLLPSVYQDTGLPIPLQIRTYLLDFSSMKQKFWRRWEFVGDATNTTLYLSWSDNDYQNFTVPTAIPMDVDRVQITRLGASRRRAWQITHTDNTPFRMLALEVDFDEGVR